LGKKIEARKGAFRVKNRPVARGGKCIIFRRGGVGGALFFGRKYNEIIKMKKTVLCSNKIED
jgi:hypothetical protein